MALQGQQIHAIILSYLGHPSSQWSHHELTCEHAGRCGLGDSCQINTPKFMTPTEEVLRIIQYWKGISECDCRSPIPQGGCLFCDMSRSEKLLESPIFLPEIPEGYYYGGVHRLGALLSYEEIKVAYIDEQGILSWVGPNNVKNKSQTEFVHTIFKKK